MSRYLSGMNEISDSWLKDGAYISGELTPLGGASLGDNRTPFESANVKHFYNNNGELKVNDVVSGSDNVSVEKQQGIAKVVVKKEEKEAVAAPIVRTGDGISLQHDETLLVKEGKLSAVQQDFEVNVEFPLFKEDESDTIQLSASEDVFYISEEGLELNVQKPLSISKRESEDDNDFGIKLDFGKGLTVNDEGELEIDVNNLTKGMGAISTASFADVPLEELITEGFDSNADTSATFLRLQTAPYFSQKSGGKKLSLPTLGYQQVPFGGVESYFDVDEPFNYNQTSGVLAAPNVEVKTSISDYGSNDKLATSANYVNQLMQGKEGGAIDVGPVENSRREIKLRLQANGGLEIDSSTQNLQVKASELIDQKTLVEKDGKIQLDVETIKGTTMKLTEGKLDLDSDALIDQKSIKLDTTKKLFVEASNLVGTSMKAENNKLDVDLSKIVDGSSIVEKDGKISSALKVVQDPLKLENNQLSFDRSKLVGETLTLSGDKLEVKTSSLAGTGLQVDGSKLAVDATALVDGDTIIVRDGKLVGQQYHFGAGFESDLQHGNNAINLDLTTDSNLRFVQNEGRIESLLEADGSTIVKD
ncbi:MAG: hypothetical protein JWM47_4590, partial [Acidimicrobiales bacterium]|nr:hypothetical protein [Acidimicrobiales bacterium]